MRFEEVVGQCPLLQPLKDFEASTAAFFCDAGFEPRILRIECFNKERATIVLCYDSKQQSLGRRLGHPPFLGINHLVLLWSLQLNFVARNGKLRK